METESTPIHPAWFLADTHKNDQSLQFFSNENNTNFLVYDVLLLATAQQPKLGFFRLRDNGDDVIVGLGEGLTSISWCLTGAANSTHIYQTIADFGIQCVLTVFVSKR